MATIVLRSVKGTPLTNAEVDTNFNDINTEVGLKLNTSAYTAADVLTKIKTVDGSGSGLDADLLDGAQSDTANTVNTIVRRDGSGNFSAGTISAAFTGNLNGNVTGNLTGTASLASLATTAITALDCSGNSATATVALSCSGNSFTATTANTVSNSAQPSITSLGTLTSLHVSGAVTLDIPLPTIQGGTGATSLFGADIATMTGAETLTNKILSGPDLRLIPNAQTGSTYTADAADATTLITIYNASPNTFYIPTNASVPYAINTTLTIVNIGAGSTVISALTPGTTTVLSSGLTTGAPILPQYEGAVCTKIDTDTWIVIGAIS